MVFVDGIGSPRALTVWEPPPPTSTTMDGRIFMWLATAPQACSIAIIMMEHFAKLRFRPDALLDENGVALSGMGVAVARLRWGRLARYCANKFLRTGDHACTATTETALSKTPASRPVLA